VSATATPTTKPSLPTPTLAVGLDPETIDALASAVAARVAELLPEPEADCWLDSRGAAAYLAVPLSTVRAWTARGELPGYQDTEGGNYYFKRSELDEWRRSNVPLR
jgi:excisionase family DNA binding protein